MSLRHLPTPIFVPLMMFLGVGMFISLVKIRYKERKSLVIGGCLIALTSINIIIDRVVREYFVQFSKYVSINMIILAVFAITGFSLVMIGAWKKVQNDPINKRLYITGISLIGISILLIGVIWGIFSVD